MGEIVMKVRTTSPKKRVAWVLLFTLLPGAGFAQQISATRVHRDSAESERRNIVLLEAAALHIQTCDAVLALDREEKASFETIRQQAASDPSRWQQYLTAGVYFDLAELRQKECAAAQEASSMQDAIGLGRLILAIVAFEHRARLTPGDLHSAKVAISVLKKSAGTLPVRFPTANQAATETCAYRNDPGAKTTRPALIRCLVDHVATFKYDKGVSYFGDKLSSPAAVAIESGIVWDLRMSGAAPPPKK